MPIEECFKPMKYAERVFMGFKTILLFVSSNTPVNSNEQMKLIVAIGLIQSKPYDEISCRIFKKKKNGIKMKTKKKPRQCEFDTLTHTNSIERNYLFEKHLHAL